MKHKLYNPLKMWMSYVGAIIGFLPFLFFKFSLDIPIISNIVKYLIPGTMIYLADSCIGGSFSRILQYCSSVFWITLINIVLYFLIGYGIHSLIRKLTKGKI